MGKVKVKIEREGEMRSTANNERTVHKFKKLKGKKESRIKTKTVKVKTDSNCTLQQTCTMQLLYKVDDHL